MVSTEDRGMKPIMKERRNRTERKRDRHAGEHHEQGGNPVERPER
jgi:hypothetical protein